MSLEYCEICEEPTGNAGRLEDSLVCGICNQVICSNCSIITNTVDDEYIICTECGNKPPLSEI